MTVWDEPWALRRERRLLTKVQRRLPAGETALRAAVVFDGASPGLVGMALDMTVQRATLGIVQSRKYFTVVLTENRLLMISNIGEKTPGDLVGEFHPSGAIRDLGERDGDNWVDVSGRRFWYWPHWKPQLVAIRSSCAVIARR